MNVQPNVRNTHCTWLLKYIPLNSDISALYTVGNMLISGNPGAGHPPRSRVAAIMTVLGQAGSHGYVRWSRTRSAYVARQPGRSGTVRADLAGGLPGYRDARPHAPRRSAGATRVTAAARAARPARRGSKRRATRHPRRAGARPDRLGAWLCARQALLRRVRLRISYSCTIA